MKKIISAFVTLSILAAFTADAQILYKIEGNGVKAPSYVFGSHHLAPISIAEEAGVIDLLNQTEQIVGEIDLTIDPMELSLALQPHMMAPADSTLSVLLAGQDMAALNSQFQKWSPMPGMQLQMLEPLKPMAISTMIAVGMSRQAFPDYNPEQQLDTYIIKTGVENGKKVVALETPQYQGEVLFDMTPLTVQADALVEVLTQPEKAVETSKILADAYKKRDINTMMEQSKEGDEHPEFMEALLYKRNAEWMKKLPQIIRDAPSFIVVGALHLAGDKGIIEGLREQGFEVTPLY